MNKPIHCIFLFIFKSKIRYFWLYHPFVNKPANPFQRRKNAKKSPSSSLSSMSFFVKKLNDLTTYVARKELLVTDV
jgi:hypothetical protein